jgi:hypothetical protein
VAEDADDGSRAAPPGASDAERQTPHDGGRMPDSAAPAIRNVEGTAGGESSECGC